MNDHLHDVRRLTYNATEKVAPMLADLPGNGHQPEAWAQTVADWLRIAGSLFLHASKPEEPSLFAAPIQPPNLLGDDNE